MSRINLYQAVAESTAPWRSSSRSCRRTAWARNSTSHYVKRQRAWRSLKTYNFRMSRPSGLLPSLFPPSSSNPPSHMICFHSIQTPFFNCIPHSWTTSGGKLSQLIVKNLQTFSSFVIFQYTRTLIVFTQVHCLTKWSPCEMPSEQHVGRHLGQKVG